MLKSYNNLAFRFMNKQKKRTFLNILGVFMSAALITGTGTIMESTKAQMINSAIRSKGNFHVAFTNVSPRQARIIEAHRAVEKSCTGVIEGFAILSETGDSDIPYRLLRLSLNDRAAMEMLQFSSLLKEGHLPEHEGEIALDETSMKILGAGVSIGSTISLPVGQRRRTFDDKVISDYIYPLPENKNGVKAEEYFEILGERKFTITGVLMEEFYMSENYSSKGLIFGNPSQSIYGANFKVQVLLNDLSHVKKTAEAMAEDMGLAKENITYNERLLNVAGKSLNPRIRRSIAGFTAIITAIIVIATIALIYNSFNIALIERINQIGVLRCIGSTPSQIRRLILREAGLICLLALPPGIIMGLMSMKWVFTLADKLSTNLLFENMNTVVSPAIILWSILICGITVFLSALFPALKAGKVSPVEAVRRNSLEKNAHISRPGLNSFSWINSHFVPLMAIRSIGRNRARFLVTLFSMVISVVLFVSFGGMQRLVKNSYLIESSPIPGIKVSSEKSDFSEDTIFKMQETAGVDLVSPYGIEQVEVLMPVDMLSSYYKGYVDNWQSFEKTGNTLVIPRGRIICYGDQILTEIKEDFKLNPNSERIFIRKSQFLNERGVKSYAPNSYLKSGYFLDIHINNRKISVPIDAVLDDVYNKDFNESEEGFDLVVSESEFFRLTGKKGFRTLFIQIAPGAEKKEIKAYLDELTLRKIGYSYIDAQFMAEEMIRETQAINLFFYGFITVIALIGSLNIVNTISTNLILRAKEFGIIQAIGLDKRGLKRIILMESFIYSSLSLLLGSIAGTAIWYLMVKEMSSIRITVFSIPWLEIGLAAIGLSIMVLISGYIPLKKLEKITIIQRIRTKG